MNRRVFASRIAEKTDHSAAAIDRILDAAIVVLAGELAKVGRFEWRGFGTFAVRTYPTRKIQTVTNLMLAPSQSRTRRGYASLSHRYRRS